MATTSKNYNILSSISAFFVWGGWAYYVNSMEGKNTGLVSGITQGIASFVITLIVVFAVTKLYNTISNNALKIILPAIISVTCIGICIGCRSFCCRDATYFLHNSALTYGSVFILYFYCIEFEKK